MAELHTKQSLFALMVAQLIYKAHDMGYDVTLGEVWRHPEWAREMEKRGIGIAKSLHCDRLAVDINLFDKDIYQENTEAYRPLGEWWKSIGGSWGGDFGDGCHFSLAHDGRR